ncbi:MAG: hypothetical protein V7763_05760 [Sulfitobacter sp.]
MVANPLHNRLFAFVDSLAGRDTETLKDAFMNEVIENGGKYDPPHDDQPHMFEICVHGICAIGPSELLAIRNWRMAATVQLVNSSGAEIEDDGFITVYPPCGIPRNHAEEIANTLAERGNQIAGSLVLNSASLPSGSR